MSSCCFQSPIIYLGSGQYWVNITVFESNIMENNSYTVLFGGLYHFPLPIVVDQNGNPAPCRLDNPNDLENGSMWTCTGKESRFRIDTNPKGVDPIIHQLSSKFSGDCSGSPVCTSTLESGSNGTGSDQSPEENHKVSLGALGNYDKGPVITAFTLSSLVVIGLIGLYFYRNRHKRNPSGQISRPILEQMPNNTDTATLSNTNLESEKDQSSRSILLAKSHTEVKENAKAKRPMNAKNLLTVMEEKSGKSQNYGQLVLSSSCEREKIFLTKDIDDNKSDQSNVPLALLYKK